MFKFFKTFFYPIVYSHTYKLSEEFVIEKIAQILSSKVTFWGSNDLNGKFITKNKFEFKIVSIAFTNGAQYGSSLVGEINGTGEMTTEIKIKAKPSLIFYATFFVSIILGFVYLYKFFQIGHIEFLITSLISMFVGTGISIGIANASISSVHHRYMMYIDKALIE